MKEENYIERTKRLMMAKFPRFGGEIAAANIQFRGDLKYHTAATDGKNIYIDPDYFASLGDDERLFIIAHEIMHIKFEHMFRLAQFDGQIRDLDIWNEATDAIINANLARDGFTIKEGYVNRPEALQYSSEEFYEILLKEREKQNKQNQAGDGQNQQGSGQQNQDQQSEGEQNQDNSQGGQEKDGSQPQQGEQKNSGDDHSMWEKAFKEYIEQSQGEKTAGKKNKEASKPKAHKLVTPQNENQEFEENREERRQQAKDHLQRLRNGELLKNSEKISLGEVGQSDPVVDWKLLVRREVEKTETIWSQRRSIAENNYAYRLEENDVDDEAETEVMIDVSGSVSLDMVKSFLRQLKPLLKESKLKVGCFNERFWGLKEIKSVRDIDRFEIPVEARGYSCWTEDWDLAVRSFSKKKEVNKFVFSDGCPCPGHMPENDLKGINVIWIIYGNKNFSPCCGKVLFVDESEFSLNAKNDESEADL